MGQNETIAGFYAPLHRALTEPILLGGVPRGALTEPILLGGVPRTVAILNGTLAAAIGLGLRLWIVGASLWLISHIAAVWAAKHDSAFADVVRRHLRYPQHLVA